MLRLADAALALAVIHEAIKGLEELAPAWPASAGALAGGRARGFLAFVFVVVVRVRRIRWSGRRPDGLLAAP